MQFTFDPVQFLTQGSQIGSLVIFVVIALTYAAGQFGLAGKGQLAFALGVGFLLGAGTQVALNGVPVLFADYFAYFLYAVVMAITPKLIYDQGKDLIFKIGQKASAAYIEKAEEAVFAKNREYEVDAEG